MRPRRGAKEDDMSRSEQLQLSPQSDYTTARLWSTSDVSKRCGELGIRLETDVNGFAFTFHDPASMKAFYSDDIVSAIAYMTGYDHAMKRADNALSQMIKGSQQ